MYSPHNNVTTTTFFTNIHTNPNSRLIPDLPSSSDCLFNFPSDPFIHYDDYDEEEEATFLQQLHGILHENEDQQHHSMLNHETNTVTTNMAAHNSCSSTVNKKILQSGVSDNAHMGKRMSKKDRHSKVITANGCRGRRMRLSINVARDFFGLQDKLGFDKASKTVEWLLTKSKTAIEELTCRRGSSSVITNSPSSASESCEVLSAIDEVKPEIIKKKEMIGGVRKTLDHPLAKELRKRARARARERTREKKRGQFGDEQAKHICAEDINLRSWMRFSSGQEWAASTNMNKNPTSVELDELSLNSCKQQQQIQGTREEISDDPLFITENICDPYAIFSYQYTSGTTSSNEEGKRFIYMLIGSSFRTMVFVVLIEQIIYLVFEL